MKFVDASYKFKFKDRKLIQGDQAGLSYDALDVDWVKAPTSRGVGIKISGQR